MILSHVRSDSRVRGVNCRLLLAGLRRKERKGARQTIFVLACCRLRDSRVRGDWEGANMKIKREFHFRVFPTIYWSDFSTTCIVFFARWPVKFDLYVWKSLPVRVLVQVIIWPWVTPLRRNSARLLKVRFIWGGGGWGAITNAELNRNENIEPKSSVKSVGADQIKGACQSHWGAGGRPPRPLPMLRHCERKASNPWLTVNCKIIWLLCWQAPATQTIVGSNCFC